MKSNPNLSESIVRWIARLAFLTTVTLILPACGGSHALPTPTPTTPPYPECDCQGPTASPLASEQVIDDKQIVLPRLGCRARVLALHNTANGDSSYRAVVAHSSGSTCDWNALQHASRQKAEQLALVRLHEAAAALPSDFRGDVLVWRRDGLPAIRQASSKADVQAWLADPLIGRIVLPSPQTVEVVPLEQWGGASPTAAAMPTAGQGGLTKAYGCVMPPLSFNMGQVTMAADFGLGASVGIIDGNRYNDPDLPYPVPDHPIYDQRVKDPAASIQLGPCGILGCDYWANAVASQMWDNASGYVKHSDPVSVGLGDTRTPQQTFERYAQALAFFVGNGVKVVNSSIYHRFRDESCSDDVTRDFELIQDYYQYKQGLLIVQALGNTCDTGPICLRVTNALVVGSSVADLSQTENLGYYGGQLEIPNVVGHVNWVAESCDDPDTWEATFRVDIPTQPGCWMCCVGLGNGFNVPPVASLAGIIAELGKKDGATAATQPETLRAIIMASANYEPLQVSDVSPYCKGCPGADICLQQDCRFGAGQVDGGNALRIYQTGDYSHLVVDAPQWQEFSEEFSCDRSDCMVKAAVAWDNAVDCDAMGCYDDGHVSHDFDLVLEQFRDGIWTPIMKAQSRESTSEWLSARLHYDTPENNRFRFAIWQVSRNVDRRTKVGFAASMGEQIKIPTKDLTPPTVTLNANVNASHVDDLRYEHRVRLDDFLSLVAEGQDVDGGLKSIRMSGEVTIQCRADGAVETKRLPYVVTETSDKKPGETARTKLRLADGFYVNEYASECSSGYSLSHVYGAVAAYAENFHDGTAGTLSFQFVAP